MEVTVRPIQPENKIAWRKLWDGYLAFYNSSVDESVYDKTLERILGGGDYEPNGLMAFVVGTPVGLVHYIYHRHCWKLNNVCYLQDLYADPSVRGRGVGCALIEAIYNEVLPNNWTVT